MLPAQRQQRAAVSVPLKTELDTTRPGVRVSGVRRAGEGGGGGQQHGKVGRSEILTDTA